MLSPRTTSARVRATPDRSARVLSVADSVVVGLGGLRSTQFLPFHSHTSGANVLGVFPDTGLKACLVPTAMQAVEDAQETSVTEARGVHCVAHRCPFQRRNAKCPPVSSPGAMHHVAEAHDTAVSLAANDSSVPTNQSAPFNPSQSPPPSQPGGQDDLHSPTATHAVADAHDTSKSDPPIRLSCGGSCSDDQPEPFQRSASSPKRPVPIGPNPMATQNRIHGQETRLSAVMEGFGLGWIDHLLPFQPSTSGSEARSPPTAVHAFGEAQETSYNTPPPSGAGGISWINQRLPFQRSANGAGMLEPTAASPTAKHARLDGHETVRSQDEVLAGIGIALIANVLPFQRSETGTPLVSLVSLTFAYSAPTAMQALADEHDTVLSPTTGRDSAPAVKANPCPLALEAAPVPSPSVSVAHATTTRTNTREIALPRPLSPDGIDSPILATPTTTAYTEKPCHSEAESRCYSARTSVTSLTPTHGPRDDGDRSVSKLADDVADDRNACDSNSQCACRCEAAAFAGGLETRGTIEKPAAPRSRPLKA
jgi:hypothetical protein